MLPAVVIRTSGSGDWEVPVEVARTPEQRSTGLMYRRSLKPGRGMLFVFDKASVRSFWMKNTYVPLDIVFIGPDKRVAGVVENAKPLSTEPRRVPAPSRWVLEVAAGQSAARGLRKGDRVYFYDIE